MTDDGGPKWRACNVGCPQPTARSGDVGEVGGNEPAWRSGRPLPSASGSAEDSRRYTLPPKTVFHHFPKLRCALREGPS